MNSFIPKYNFKFANNLPRGNKRYIINYVNQMISEFVYDMGSLENNPFTFPEVQTLLEGITVGGRRISDQNQIINIKDSWQYVIDLVRLGSFDFDKNTMCSIHNIVAKDEALIVGDFRNGDIGIAGTSSYECIKAESLSDVFYEGLESLNLIDNVLERAIILNLWLSYCQFFYDGNKRTARLMSNLILLSEGVGVLSIPAKYKVEYNTLMIDFYDTLEADKIIEFLVNKCTTFFDEYSLKKYNDVK